MDVAVSNHTQQDNCEGVVENHRSESRLQISLSVPVNLGQEET